MSPLDAIAEALESIGIGDGADPDPGGAHAAALGLPDPFTASATPVPHPDSIAADPLLAEFGLVPRDTTGMSGPQLEAQLFMNRLLTAGPGEMTAIQTQAEADLYDAEQDLREAKAENERICRQIEADGIRRADAAITAARNAD